MGILSRMLVPRGVRRALHPAGAIKSAATPKIVKKATRALHPVDNAVYGVTRALSTKPKPRSTSPSFKHGSCPVNHRTAEVATKCRKG